MVAKMVPMRHTQDLAMWPLLQPLGRIPRRLIWDNESGIGGGKRHAEGVGAFTGTWQHAGRAQALRPRVEGSGGNAGRVLRTSVMPVDVHADLARVEVRQHGGLAAAHDRVWLRGQTVTDTDHVAAANGCASSSSGPDQPSIRTRKTTPTAG